jgi:hypothetical protein
MKKYFAIGLLLLSAATLHAEGQATRSLIQPKGTASDLKLTELKNKDELLAKFSGQTWVNGTFVVRWPAGAGATADRTPDYVLVPDPASISILPHFRIIDPPFKNSYKVKGIEIQNGAVALRLAFTEATAKKILEHKANSIRVTGRFLIESYEVGVECDAPWARASLVKADLPDQLAVVHRKVEEGC